MECYCFATNKPIRREITKPQTATVISLWFWGLLAYPELYWDWPAFSRMYLQFSQIQYQSDGMTIKRFHSRDQHLCKLMGTKESVCIRKEFNSHGTGLEHQHGRRFIVLEHQYGGRDVMWKRSVERFRITFTSNCTTWLSLPFSQGWQWSLFRHWNNFYDAKFIHQIYFGKFHFFFLIWEVVNLNLRFAVCPKRDSKFLW